MDAAAIYAAERRALIDLVRHAGPEAAGTTVPASPAWTVKDVLAHLAGIADDTLAGRLEGLGTDPWTAAQVDARRDRSLDEVIAEWEQRGTEFEGLIAQMPPHVAAATMGDLTTHAHDVRAALERPGERDSAGVAMATGYYVERFRRRADRAGLPALAIQAGDARHRIGEGDAEVTVAVPPFELYRALTGRRSQGQIAAWDWSGDPAPYAGLLSTYGHPDADVEE